MSTELLDRFLERVHQDRIRSALQELEGAVDQIEDAGVWVHDARIALLTLKNLLP